jgi:hypothetical protein
MQKTNYTLTDTLGAGWQPKDADTLWTMMRAPTSREITRTTFPKVPGLPNPEENLAGFIDPANTQSSIGYVATDHIR